jgi:hypothetical protein
MWIEIVLISHVAEFFASKLVIFLNKGDHCFIVHSFRSTSIAINLEEAVAIIRNVDINEKSDENSVGGGRFGI